MKTFITDNFLLSTQTARTLYHDFAKEMPIFDYHTHLSPQLIADDHRFADLGEAWLAGDHYKWRAMRANGVEEKFCTGEAGAKEKFLAWAKTVPATLRNPLYHWTHLELLRYFDVDDLLDPSTAEAVWEKANARLAQPDRSVLGLFAASRVALVCSTDDPADDLAAHRMYAASGKSPTKLFPTFRPDKALAVHQPEAFSAWADKLSTVSGMKCDDLEGLLAALESRHTFFHENGCRLSDHGLDVCFGDPCSPEEAARIFRKARSGEPATAEERDAFGSFLMIFFGRLDAKRGWVKQLHLGALRNSNARMLRRLGPDTGFDSIADHSHAVRLARYLDALDSTNELPKTILYNLNPADNYVFATMIGNFQDGSVAGKIQFGSGWWFLDQREGMEWQMNALSNLGLLSRFVGMLTDSRSFLSYSRHEYFRRILCNLLGREIEAGELPNDLPLVGGMVRDICFRNAAAYFGLPLDPKFTS